MEHEAWLAPEVMPWSTSVLLVPWCMADGLAGELFRAFHGEPTVFAPMPHCFELFGVDFLVDEGCHVHLLEVNPGPDFKQTGGRLKKVIQDLIETTIAMVFRDEDHLQGGEVEGEPKPLKALAQGSFVKVYEEASHQVPGARMRLF